MSKKLICVLVVLALALCVFPMVGLPATKAEAATFDNSNLVDTNTTDDKMTAVCPHCGGDAVEWTELAYANNGPWETRIGYRNNAGKVHVYLSENRTQVSTARFLDTAGTTDVCLHLNGNNLEYISEMQIGAGTSLTVMGNGNVTFLATGNSSYVAQAIKCVGTVNLYGGTWNNADGVTALGVDVAYTSSGNSILNVSGTARIIPVVQAIKNVSRVNLDQNGSIDQLNMAAAAKLTVAGTWTGSATVSLAAQPDATGLYSTDKIEATGAFTGTLTRDDGVRLVADGSAIRTANATTDDDLVDLTPGDGVMNAVCPVCGGDPVTWTQFTSTVSEANNPGKHYYLATDLTAAGSTWYSNMLSLASGTMCFHLNGNTLTTGSRLQSRGGATMNIIAGDGGSVIFTGEKADVFFFGNGGHHNIYGGIYTFTPAAGSTAFGIARPANGNMNFYDATLNGNVVADGSLSTTLVTLNGTTTVNGAADFTKTGKLTLADGWNGTITEYKPNIAAINTATGVLSAARITAQGTYSGTINGGLVWNGSAFVSKACIVKGDILVPYPNAAAAAAAYTDADFTAKNVVRLIDDGTAELAAGKNYYIDANGNDVTVSGTGTLYPMDSANDKFDAAKCGEWTVANSVTVKNDVECGNRYITIKTGTTYTAHRVEMKLTHVTLKTSNAGIYFKAQYKCDDVLAARVTRYGTAVSKNAIPVAVGQTGDSFTEFTSDFTPDTISHSVQVNSGAVVNILKDDPEINNKARAEITLHAKVYFSVQIDDAVETATDFLSAQCGSYSLYDVLNAIDTNWGEYNEAQRTTAHNFYNTWKGKGAPGCCIEDFGFTNIPDATKLAYKLQVGYAYFDITPDEDTVTSLILGGRGANNVPSGLILDSLPGTCIAFTDENGQTVLMYTLDLLYVSDEIVDFVADISTATNVSESNILINGTHSHSAPHPVSALYSQNANYINGLKAKMIAAGNAAIADQKEAKMYTASVNVPNMNSVRHYLMSDGTYLGDNFGDNSLDIVRHAEDADNQLQLIKFVRDGSDVLLMNWQGHPNRSYVDTLAIISGLDIMREMLLEKDMLLAFFLGASGNVNNSSRISGEIPTQDNYVLHYQTLANKIIEVLETSSAFEEVAVGKLQVLKKTVSLVARDGVSLKNMSIYGFSVGDVAFAIAPYEMFNASGLFIKENSPYDTTFVSTCSMGTSSYIPTDEVYDFTVNGDTGAGDNHVVYEANGCQFARGSAEILAEEYVILLRELKAG